MSKAGSKFCLIYYYVPEDKDDPEFPNAFGVNIAVEDVKLADIRKHFPLEGEYIFRFKIKVGNSNVWMDVREDSKIQLYNGKIIMKATRVSWENKQRHANDRSREETKSASQNGFTASSNSGVSPQTQAPTHSQGQSSSNTYNFEDFNLLSTTYSNQTGSNSNTPSSTKAQPSNDSHNLLDFGHSGHSDQSKNTYTVNKDANKKPDLLSFDNLF